MGHSVVLGAADTFRAAAADQLETWGRRVGASTVRGAEGADPASVAFDAVATGVQEGADVVLVDTAGRLHTSTGLMDQLGKVKRVVEKKSTVDEVLLVLDATVGQNGIAQARVFREVVDITGVVLTKLDGDARGGAALSIREVTGKPILFASTGEKLDDFDVFHPERMSSRILGMGDLLSLIEHAETVFDQKEAEEAASRLGTGELTLEDFLNQMLMIRRMGPIGNLLKMMPGGKQMNQMADMVDEKQLDRIQAIIRGMTPEERANPKILNASRRKRIAAGSGVKVSDVNQLVERFFEAKKMMGAMANQFGLPGMPGMGGGRSATKKKPKGRRGKNGKRKPAKRRGGGPKMPGMPQMPGMPGMEDLQKMQEQLPPGMEGLDLNNLDFGAAMKRMGKKK